jgi:5-methylcytosine-specific restriction protein B
MNKKSLLKELVSDFNEWFEDDLHKEREFYYQDKITDSHLRSLSDEEFKDFFYNFVAEGGKVQSGGDRSKNTFKANNLDSNFTKFKNYILEPFSDDFDVVGWLKRNGEFKHFGKGLATIYLNRVDKEKYPIYNEKTADAYKILGFEIPRRLELAYPKLQAAQKELISEYPALKNFYKADSLNHFLVATEAGEVYKERLSGNLNTIGDVLKETIFHPLNQILFGPPGTGKTYNTINQALSIADPNFELSQSRELVVKRFHELQESGQIVFTTFHQSMSYEDFVEGIKPSLNSDDITYVLKEGVFKSLCKKSMFEKDQLSDSFSFDILYDAYIDEVKEEFESGEERVYKTKTGSELVIHGFTSNNSIRLITKDSQRINSPAPQTKENVKILYDIITSGHDTDNFKELDREFGLKKGLPVRYALVKDLIAFEQKFERGSINNLEPSKFSFQELIEKFNKETAKPHILIIDEINRGNISAIFGELITLLEDDKRLGADNEIKVTLPYSKEEFAVPPNLHIIGTMNTADRSVEALDTALRRRFSFVEMMPEPELLHPICMLWRLWEKYNVEKISWNDENYVKEANSLYALLDCSWSTESDYEPEESNVEYHSGASIWDNWGEKPFDLKVAVEGFEKHSLKYFGAKGVNLESLLKVINQRLEYLCGRDHTIGHAFFMKVNSLESLKEVFKNKVIPQLQEYFYGDWSQIQLVLGKYFIEKKQFSRNELWPVTDSGNQVEDDKVIWKMVHSKYWTKEHFQSIYNSKIIPEKTDSQKEKDSGIERTPAESDAQE